MESMATTARMESSGCPRATSRDDSGCRRLSAAGAFDEAATMECGSRCPDDFPPRCNEVPMAARKKAATKKAAKRTVARKRELIDTGSNKLYIRRNRRGTSFAEVEDVGRSLAQ